MNLFARPSHLAVLLCCMLDRLQSPVAQPGFDLGGARSVGPDAWVLRAPGGDPANFRRSDCQPEGPAGTVSMLTKDEFRPLYFERVLSKAFRSVRS